MDFQDDYIKGLEEQAEQLVEKLNAIRKVLTFEDDPTRQLKYETQIADAETELAETKKKITEAIADKIDPPKSSPAAESGIVLHDHHQYTCDRIKQDVRFHKVFKTNPSSKAHFFYLYGMNVQSHQGLFNRFAYALEGRLLDYLNPEFESKCRAIKKVLTFDLAQDEEYDKQQIISHLFAALNVSYDKFEPLLEKDLNYLYQNSPVAKDLCKDDYVCVLLGISSYDWDAELIPQMARWFITKFCASQLPEDAPTFLFFFGIIFENEDAEIHKEVEEMVKKSSLIFGLPELKEVTLRDVESWFSKYNFITKTVKEREVLIDQSFGNATNFDMEEVEIRLLKIIDIYNSK